MRNRRRKASMRPDEVRALFERAHETRPDAAERLAGRVPELLGEVRRRGPQPRPTVSDAIVPLAARWLPAMAAAAAVLVAAVFVVGTDGSDGTDVAASQGGFDRLVLLGSWNDGAGDDAVLRALMSEEDER